MRRGSLVKVAIWALALASVLSVTSVSSGAPTTASENCLSQRQRPCGFYYDVTWNVTWRNRKAPAPDINVDGSLKVTFPRVRISGGVYGGRVQMSGDSRTPRVARIGLTVRTPGCEGIQEYKRPVTLTVTAGGTFFAGFRQDGGRDPLAKCEESSRVPLSSLAQWDAGCTRRDNVVWNCRTKGRGFLHAGSTFEGTSTVLLKGPGTPSRLPFPVDRLWTGRSFVITEETTKTAKFFEGASLHTFVRLTFTRRR
jgi:hypothetical protein